MSSAQVLPDKHIVKKPLECCQMLSIVASEKWGHNYGDLPRQDGTPYKTSHGAFRNHPCTIWANSHPANARWLIEHAYALCREYTLRFGKRHTCEDTIDTANDLFPQCDSGDHTPFVRAMPEEYKFDDTISTFDAYRMYLVSKPWLAANYVRIPTRKPGWV